MKFKIGDIVEATKTITRVDGRASLPKGRKAKITQTYETKDGTTIVGVDTEFGGKIGSIVCDTMGQDIPLRLAS